jgi:predicted ATPase/DNA-binding SARP family transcriptional activator
VREIRAEEGSSVNIEIDLFGVLQVRHEGHPVAVRGDIPRGLVGYLALRPGEHVPTHDLVDAVWAEAPDNVLSTLRAHLSRLRTAGLGAALIGARGGYVLDVARDAVDVVRWRDAAARLDDPGRQCDPLGRLSELVAGAGRELMTGLDALPFVPRSRDELERIRRELEEDLGEAALERGDPGLATAVLTETVARHPLHERPARLLASALARSARHSDAIETLDAFADRLRADAGLDVSLRVQALRASIVRLDPAVVAPAPVGRTVERFGVPIPLTRFIGRTDDLRDLHAARRTTRLLTIVGPAGVGKTRIAIELARAATTSLDDEQYMVDLADVTDPDAVVGAIASVVRASELTLDAVVRRVDAGRVLLVLDNADHLLGALAVAVDALLARTAELRILVTSREPLRLAEEYEYVLRPFSGDTQEDAWRLFAERARDARGGRGFDDDEEREARMLSDEIDGIPLALELAAARLDVLEIADVRAGIGAGNGPGRHDSLRSAIGWTVDLLDAPHRDLLIALARFAGPFTPEAVAGITGIAEDRTRAMLDTLIGKSLVAVDRGDTGRRRMRILESTRAYAATLDAPESVAAWRSRHRAWFAGMVRSLAPSLRTFVARDTMAVLDGFRADLASAMDSAVADGDRVSAVRLAGGLAHYWYLRGLLREGRDRIDRALALPGPAVDAEPVAQLEVANLAYQLGDAPAAFVAIAAALDAAQDRGDSSVVAVALARAGYGRSMFGDLAAGEELIARARGLLEAAEPWAHSEVEMATGQKLRAEGRYEDALTAVTESHRIAASIGYTWMVTSSRYVMAKVLVDARRAAEAIAVAGHGAEWARRNEDAAAALALVHVVAGACAYVERHEIGARLLGAVDEIGLRYDYSTAAAEGADADRLRTAIAAGLAPGEFEREYRNGRRLGWDDVAQLIDRLPRTGARMLAG